jgi:fucose permease
MRPRARPPVLLSYATFVLIGVAVGGGGVLLLAQMNDYGVDRATIGITFFTGSVGFVLAGLCAGALIHRFGIRIALAVGGGAYMLASGYLASRPPFAAFVTVQLVTGFGGGVVESALNAYIAALPSPTTLLNRLHAFFGVGALIGPVMAAWIVGSNPWTVVYLVVALTFVPLVAGYLMAYPGIRGSSPPPEVPAVPGPAPGVAAIAEPAPDVAEATEATGGSLLGAALRDRGVLLGAAMLTVYVGLEIGMGNWGYSYLVQSRGLTATVAGYSVSGYWLGLTLGRFLISPVASKLGVSTVGMMYACLTGVAVATTLAWLSPVAAGASAALLLLGFCLGPIFPTTMAIAPQLTHARLTPTAIGVMNSASTVGGAALPWLAGVIAQNAGIRMLLPFTLALAAIQFAVWWPLASHIRQTGPAHELSSQQAG